MFRSVILCVTGVAGAVAAAGPPPTPRRPVTDVYHGVAVTDEYRWLEDGDDPAVRAWIAAQNEFARSFLDRLPQAEQVRKEVTAILSQESPHHGDLHLAGGRVFALKEQPPREQPFLVVLPALESPEEARVILDPTTLNPEGTTAIDWYQPSPDGQFVAVSLSEGGDESGDLFLYEVDSGQQVFETIPHVNSGTAGGSLAWTPDSLGFFYTRHFPVDPDNPEDDRVYQHVYYHELGTAHTEDRYELGAGFPPIAEIQLTMDRRSGRLLATVQNGDGGEFAHYLREPHGNWRQFSRFEDDIQQAVFGPRDDLYLVSLAEAPRGKILRVPIADLNVAKAELVIPQGPDAIVTGGEAFWGARTVVPTETRLYVVYQQGGPSEIRAFDHSGRPLPGPQQSPVSAVSGLLPLEGDRLLFERTSFLEPPAYYVFDPATGETRQTPLAMPPIVDFSDAEVRREFAVSKDGTRVPLNIILRRGTPLDGHNPCIATGYGGYGVNIEPRYRPLCRLSLDRGVITVVANLRGGGEYGAEWHRQGNLTRKQNVFDDFAAVLRHLIERKYTEPSRLGIIGGSNGGLLMGATLVQHPELVKAVVAEVGMYDMLRTELTPNGQFNITEFGTVTDPEQFRALYAYSPYHHVRDGTAYPAALFTTGENDPRVDPAESRKMVARLQAATSSSAPILLRTSASAGHGGSDSLSEQIAQTVDILSFLYDQLGATPLPDGARHR